MGAMLDVHERQLTEEHMEFQASVLSQVSDAVVAIDYEHRITYWNHAAVQLYNVQADDALGRKLEEVYQYRWLKPEDEQAAWVALQTTGTWHGQNIHVKKTGELIQVESTVSVLNDESGTAIGLLAVIRDITERVHAEQALRAIKDSLEITIAERTAELRKANERLSRELAERKEAEEALRQSEERYRDIVNTADEGIWIIDADRNTEFVNSKMAAMLGYRVDEMIGQSLFAFMDEEGKATAANVERRHQGIKEQHDFKFRRKDGGDLWVIISTNPLFDQAGRYAGALGMVTDITERKRMEETLRRRVQELAALQATVLEITASPDLPTLLHTIVERAARLLDAKGGGLHLCDPERQEVRCVVSYATLSDYTGIVLKYGEGAVGAVAQSGKPLIVDDYRTWRGRAAVYEQEQPFNAVLSVPMIWRGQVTGVLDVLRDEGTPPFTRADQELLSMFANHATIIVEQARLYFAVSQELEERKQVEQALRESEARATQARTQLLDAIESLTEAFALYDAQDHLVLSNSKFHEFFQYAADLIAPGARFEDRLRANVYRGLIADAIGREEEWIQERLAQHRNPQGVYLQQLSNGRWLQISEHKTKDGGIVGVRTDITERKRAEDELKRRNRELAALNAVVVAINQSFDLRKVLTAALKQIVALSAVDGAECHLTDHAGKLALTAQHGLEPEFVAGSQRFHFSAGTGIPGEAFASGLPLYVPDVLADERYLRRELARAAGYRSLLCVPILGREAPLGSFMLYSRATREFPSEEQQLLMTIGDQLGVAIERAQLYEAEQHARQIAETLRAANVALTQTLELDAVLESLLEFLDRLVPYDSASVMLLEADAQFAVRAARGYEEWINPEQVRGISWDAHATPLLRQMLTTQQSVLVPDTYAHPDWVRVPGLEYIRNWLGVPLVAGRKVIGLFSVDKAQADFFTAEHARLAEDLAAQAAVAIQNARLFKQVRVGRERLQALSERLVEVQESERRHIARELHDEIGQTLTGIKLTLEMSTRLPADALKTSLEKAQLLVNDLMERVHDLSLDLRPTLLDDLGLLPALLWHFEHYTAQTQVKVICEHSGLERRFRPEIETAAYRIVQEALTNVARYAKVSEVRVQLWADEHQLDVQIEDQGDGFDLEAVQAESALSGLAGMRERAMLLGGQLSIESHLGVGTCLVAELPLAWPMERRRKRRDEQDDHRAGR